MLCFEWASETNDITFKCIDYLYNLGYTKFYIQMKDNYTFGVHNDNDFDDIRITKIMLSKTTLKEDWGMIWCK